MHTNTTPRTWRVTLADGRTIEVVGRKVVVTDSGALMIVAASSEPTYIAANWCECIEATADRRDSDRER